MKTGWDREIWRDGRFQFHPEYVEALRQQGLTADASLLIDTEVVEIAKEVQFAREHESLSSEKIDQEKSQDSRVIWKNKHKPHRIGWWA